LSELCGRSTIRILRFEPWTAILMSLVNWLEINGIINVEGASVFYLFGCFHFVDILVIISVSSGSSRICAQLLAIRHRLNISKCRF
jgi:hypothetical protein